MEGCDRQEITKKRRGRKPLPEDIREMRKKESYKKYESNKKNIGAISTREDLSEELIFLKRVIAMLHFFSKGEMDINKYINEEELLIEKYKKKELNNEIR